MITDSAGGAISRRRFLSTTAGAAGLVALAPWEAAASAAAAPRPRNAPFDTVVVAMLENRSFDHLLGWLPGANGRQAGLRYRDRSGNVFATHDLGNDFTGCGNTEPDHSWYGEIIEFDRGRNDGWLRTPPGRSPSNTFPLGYYTEAAVPTLGALARNYSTLDGYFASSLSETFPNRMYQHAAQTDRDQGPDLTALVSGRVRRATVPTIWDRLARAGVSGRYYYSDEPFTAAWGSKYLSISSPITRFFADAAAGTLPRVAFVDPKFTNAGSPRNDSHPLGDVRLGDKFISDVYQAIRTSPQWGRTVLIVCYDEGGGFFDHVAPPRVVDNTNPARVDHTRHGPGTKSAPRGSHPDYRRLGFRVPCVVVSPFSRSGAVHGGPYEHTSVLRMIEWRWGLRPLTARDQHARNLANVLDFTHANTVPASAIPAPAPFVPQSCQSATPGIGGIKVPPGIKVPGV